MYKYLIVCAILSLVASSSSFAMDGCSAGKCAKCHTLTLDEANSLLRSVGTVRDVQPAPVNGLWKLELEKDGRRGVVFMDYGKKNLIAGTVFPLESGKQEHPEAGKALNGTAAPDAQPESGKVGRPSAALKVHPDGSGIPLENSVVIGNRAGHTRLFVFLDPDCPFCGMMYAEMKKLTLMEPDLAVYIKMFPLQMHPGAYDRARVIIGDGSPALLDRAFAGAPLAPPEADYGKAGVDETIRIAAKLGILVTPTLVLPDGRVMPGFKDAAALRKLLRTYNSSPHRN